MALFARLEKGIVVTVYQDPITEEKPEGKARLIKRLMGGLDDQEPWLVQFGNGDRVVRWINKQGRNIKL